MVPEETAPFSSLRRAGSFSSTYPLVTNNLFGLAGKYSILRWKLLKQVTLLRLPDTALLFLGNLIWYIYCTSLTGAKSRRNIKAKEVEEPEVEEESQRSSKRAKKSLDPETELNDSIYAAHPLSVVIHVFDDIEKELKLLDLRFEFLTKLKVVCAGIENTKSGEGDSTKLLANLFADDTGLDLPNEVSYRNLNLHFCRIRCGIFFMPLGCMRFRSLSFIRTILCFRRVL